MIQVKEEHAKLGEAYATALQQFNTTDPETGKKVDVLVRGVDRPASEGLEALALATEGLALVATILFWNWVIDTLDYRFPTLGLNGSAPRLVVSNGRLLRKNMDKERLSEEQLMSHLREQGVEDLERVRKAYVEGDGRISVIKAS